MGGSRRSIMGPERARLLPWLSSIVQSSVSHLYFVCLGCLLSIHSFIHSFGKCILNKCKKEMALSEQLVMASSVSQGCPTCGPWDACGSEWMNTAQHKIINLLKTL